MLIMLMCPSCNNLNQLDTIECNFCENNLIGENVELHAEYEPDIISATKLFVEHNPLDDGYVEYLTRATVSEVEKHKENYNKNKDKPQYSADTNTLYFVCSNAALILETMGYDVFKFRLTMGIRKASDLLLIEASKKPKLEFSTEDELWASEMLDTIIEAISRFTDFQSMYRFIFENLLELEDWIHPDEKPITSGPELSDLLAEINATILAANSGSPYTWVNEFSTTHTQVGIIAHFCHQTMNHLNHDTIGQNNNKKTLVQENTYTKSYLLGLGERWGIDAEAGHLIEKGFRVQIIGQGKYSVDVTVDIAEMEKEKEKLTLSIEKNLL